MARKSTMASYQYRAGDNLPNLAKQYQTTEQEILKANPGGYPFSTGQVINVPQALAGMGGLANPYSYQSAPPMVSPVALRGGLANPAPRYRYDISPTIAPAPGMAPVLNPLAGYGGTANPMGYTPPDKTERFGPAPGAYIPPPPGGVTSAGNSDFANTGFMQYNAANNIPFERQLRWDPKKKKYITVGQWLKQGRKAKADANRAKANKQEQQQEQQQDFTLANSLIDFSAAAG